MSDEIVLWTEKEAAAVLRISPRSLLTLRQRGDVPSVRLGSRVFYQPEVLKAWLRDRDGCQGVGGLPDDEHRGLVVLDDGTVGTDFVFVVTNVEPIEG